MRELHASVDSAEFTEWAAFDRVEPIGGPGHDWRAGIVAATLVNIHKREGTATAEPRQFIPWAQQPEPAALDDESLVDAFDRLVGLD